MAKLLVVDDSATERDHLQDLLIKAGHLVMAATSGKEGVERARSERPDLILMDILMDDMDGFHATRLLKEDAATKSIPVVMVSSKNQRADKMWAQLQGAGAYVVKPYSREDILQVIDRALGVP